MLILHLPLCTTWRERVSWLLCLCYMLTLLSWANCLTHLHRRRLALDAASITREAHRNWLPKPLQYLLHTSTHIKGSLRSQCKRGLKHQTRVIWHRLQMINFGPSRSKVKVTTRSNTLSRAPHTLFSTSSNINTTVRLKAEVWAHREKLPWNLLSIYCQGTYFVEPAFPNSSMFWA